MTRDYSEKVWYRQEIIVMAEDSIEAEELVEEKGTQAGIPGEPIEMEREWTGDELIIKIVEVKP